MGMGEESEMVGISVTPSLALSSLKSSGKVRVYPFPI